MNNITQKRNKPQYFSDYFHIEKSRLKELGVFNPILNFDTKVFVDPLLLKNSSSEIIRNAARTFDRFFINLIALLKISQQEADKPWRQAKRIVNFPEYKYTCIGYGADSINGSGSGAELNDKILRSAKDIVAFAKDDPSIFLILPLLEEGIGADIISDMTQNIIDQNICEFTVDIMQRLGLEANCQHRARNNVVYNLIKNPFSACPIKLLPSDILSDLPLADTLDEWLSKMADINSNLRDCINKHLGHSFFEETKKRKKEVLLDLLKTDKAFFMEVLKALKNHDFTYYDIEEDWQGLHRWLKDSEKFIKFKSSNKIGFLNDDLEEIFLAVREIIDHFKYSIEKEELWRIFWTSRYAKLTHVKEFYSQMLFYMVATSWVSSKDNNLTVVRSLDKETKMINFKFSVSGKYSVNVHVKHSDNYGGLKKCYEKRVKNVCNRQRDRDYYLVMNFQEEKSAQLQAITASEREGYKIIEISVANQEILQSDILLHEPINLEFNSMFTEFEKAPNKYSEGAHKRHGKTDIIKSHIIKPLFNNKALIKGTTVKQRSDNIYSKIMSAFNDKTDPNKLANFVREYQLDYKILSEAREYFEEDKSEIIYKWCRQFGKNKNNQANTKA